MLASVVAGIALGALSALLHLGVTALRARLWARGRVAWSLLLLPFGFAGFAAAVLVLRSLGSAGVLGLPLGIFFARKLVLYGVAGAS